MKTLAELTHYDGLLTERLSVDEEPSGDVLLFFVTEECGEPGMPEVMHVPAAMRAAVARAMMGTNV